MRRRCSSVAATSPICRHSAAFCRNSSASFMMCSCAISAHAPRQFGHWALSPKSTWKHSEHWPARLNGRLSLSSIPKALARFLGNIWQVLIHQTQDVDRRGGDANRAGKRLAMKIIWVIRSATGTAGCPCYSQRPSTIMTDKTASKRVGYVGFWLALLIRRTTSGLKLTHITAPAGCRYATGLCRRTARRRTQAVVYLSSLRNSRRGV